MKESAPGVVYEPEIKLVAFIKTFVGPNTTILVGIADGGLPVFSMKSYGIQTPSVKGSSGVLQTYRNLRELDADLKAVNEAKKYFNRLEQLTADLRQKEESA